MISRSRRAVPLRFEAGFAHRWPNSIQPDSAIGHTFVTELKLRNGMHARMFCNAHRQRPAKIAPSAKSQLRFLYLAKHASGDGSPDSVDGNHEIGEASCRERGCQYV